jgi:integrase
MLMRLAKTEDVAHRDRRGAVAATTASDRLRHIAEFLDWYLKNILDLRIRSSQLRAELRDRYESTALDLKKKIRGGNATHPTQIRSVPTDVFKRIIREIFVHPERSFCTESGATSATLKRDRSIFLLACEGMRPGAIGNLMLEDFDAGQVRIQDNAGRRGHRVTEGTPVQKGARSNKQEYNSELSMTLWPWTIEAIHDYINTEREALLDLRLHNVSKGFLFLEIHRGGPIKNRKSISDIFERAEANLLSQGLLARSSADRHIKAKNYDLTAYTLRHSSATLYASEKGGSDQTKSEMKERFGWVPSSTMPDRYARRANMDAADLDLADFWDSIKAERSARKGQPQ